MSFENYKNAENLSAAEIMRMFDKIENPLVLELIDKKTNYVGLEILRNQIDTCLDIEPANTQRIAEILTVLTMDLTTETELLEEKIDELIKLVQ